MITICAISIDGADYNLKGIYRPAYHKVPTKPAMRQSHPTGVFCYAPDMTNVVEMMMRGRATATSDEVIPTAPRVEHWFSCIIQKIIYKWWPEPRWISHDAILLPETRIDRD